MQQMHKKVEQIVSAAQNSQLALLTDCNADSYAHCEQVMEEEIDYLDRSGAVLAQFAAVGNLTALQNHEYLQSTQKLIQQLRQRFNSVVAVSESRREAALFFCDADISLTMAKLQGDSLNPKSDRFDREVSLPLIIKTSYYDKMMEHNRQLANQLKDRYASQKPKTQIERPRTQQTQNNASSSKDFKGLQTLKMLEKQLGLTETTIEELNPFTKQNQAFNSTDQSFYSTNQFLATSDNFQSQSRPHNYVFTIQEQYMRQLEEQYKYLQSTKQAKMLQVVNTCRRIQRFWRRSKELKRIKSAIVIQRFFRFRQLLRRKKWVVSSKQSKLGRLKRMLAGLKIKRWLVAKFRRQRQKCRHVTYPESHIPKLIRVQAFVRGFLVRKSKLWRQFYRERKYVQTTKMFKKYLRLQKPIAVLQSKQMSVLSEQVARRETLDEYIVKAIAEFEAGWLVHEHKLKKYELTQAKLTDWEEKKSPEGTHWLNLKTGEKTTQHPGFNFFKINRRSMRKRAEEKFQRDVITPLEHERERMSIKSEKQLTTLLNDIVGVYKFNLHKIYLN